MRALAPLLGLATGAAAGLLLAHWLGFDLLGSGGQGGAAVAAAAAGLGGGAGLALARRGSPAAGDEETRP